MKKLLLILALCFAFISSAFAAVDLNTATQAELESVNGIGPVKAKSIIEYRARNAPFKRVDDLTNVKGFGKKTVDKVRAEVAVGGGSAKAASKLAGKPDKSKPAADAKNDTSKK